jgi:thioredoxin-like negative regulator of GroEL
MNEQALLQQAKDAVRAGRKAEAQELLRQVLQANPRSEQAWLVLAAAMNTAQQRSYCLQRALAVNPSNQQVQQELARLQQRVPTPPVQIAAAPKLDHTMSPPVHDQPAQGQQPHKALTKKKGSTALRVLVAMLYQSGNETPCSESLPWAYHYPHLS